MSERIVVARDKNDIGNVFTVSGNKFRATAPDGVLDPQPHPLLAETMVKRGVFSWRGFEAVTNGALENPRTSGRVPTPDEMRARLAIGTPQSGPVNPSSADAAVRRVVEQNRAFVADGTGKVPSPTEMRAATAETKTSEATAAEVAKLDAMHDLAATLDGIGDFDDIAIDEVRPKRRKG